MDVYSAGMINKEATQTAVDAVCSLTICVGIPGNPHDVDKDIIKALYEKVL